MSVRRRAVPWWLSLVGLLVVFTAASVVAYSSIVMHLSAPGVAAAAAAIVVLATVGLHFGLSFFSPWRGWSVQVEGQAFRGERCWVVDGDQGVDAAAVEWSVADLVGVRLEEHALGIHGARTLTVLGPDGETFRLPERLVGLEFERIYELLRDLVPEGARECLGVDLPETHEVEAVMVPDRAAGESEDQAGWG